MRLVVPLALLAACAPPTEAQLAWRHDMAAVRAVLRSMWVVGDPSFAETGTITAVQAVERPCVGGGLIRELTDGEGLEYVDCRLGDEIHDGAVRGTEGDVVYEDYVVRDALNPEAAPRTLSGGYESSVSGDIVRVVADLTISGPGFDGGTLTQGLTADLRLDQVTGVIAGGITITLDDSISPEGRSEMSCSFVSESADELLDLIVADPSFDAWQRVCPNGYQPTVGVWVAIEHREPFEPPGGIPLAFSRADLGEPYLEADEIQPLGSDLRLVDVEPGAVMVWGAAEGGREEPRFTATCPPAYDGARFDLIYSRFGTYFDFELACVDAALGEIVSASD